MVKQRNSMIESELTLEESLATFSETDKLAAQRSKLADKGRKKRANG